MLTALTAYSWHVKQLSISWSGQQPAVPELGETAGLNLYYAARAALLSKYLQEQTLSARAVPLYISLRLHSCTAVGCGCTSAALWVVAAPHLVVPAPHLVAAAFVCSSLHMTAGYTCIWNSGWLDTPAQLGSEQHGSSKLRLNLPEVAAVMTIKNTLCEHQF